MRKLLASLLSAALLCACGDGFVLQPASGGSAYEVLVTGEEAELVDYVAETLRSVDAEGLPQPEPMFEVSAVKAKGLTQATRYARNMVVVSEDTALQHLHMTYRRDVYARQQIIVSLRTPSLRVLAEELPDGLGSLVRQLHMQELNNGIRALRSSHNKAAATLAEALFGIRLWVPNDLSRLKQGEDFLWLADNAAQGMQSVCVYRYKAHALSAALQRQMRDSIMRVNMPGQAEGSYMTTRSVMRQQADSRTLLLRGLWETQGDAMGGPFASRSFCKGDSVVTVEIFVYAPEGRKRNLMHRLEPSLYSPGNND